MFECSLYENSHGFDFFRKKSYSDHPNDITGLVFVSYEFLYARSANSAISITYQTESNIKSNACCYKCDILKFTRGVLESQN